MKTLKDIGKALDKLKINNFVSSRTQIVSEQGQVFTEIFFPKFTHADKAILFFNSQGITHTGRESNTNVNAYYKFKVEIQTNQK